MSEHVVAALQDILDKVHLRNTNKRNFTILNSVSGVIKPGVFTLLLGPPGSGKTTLLTALAGKLQGVGGVKVRGADHSNHSLFPLHCWMRYCCTLLAALAVMLQGACSWYQRTLNGRDSAFLNLEVRSGPPVQHVLADAQ